MAGRSEQPDIPDNHRSTWLALLAAAELYCQQSGCELAILTAGRKARPPPSEQGDFSYGVWGSGILAEAARRYVDDIGVLHSTTMLMAQRQRGGAKLELNDQSGLRGVGCPTSGVTCLSVCRGLSWSSTVQVLTTESVIR